MINFSKIGQSNNVNGYVDGTYPWRVYDAWGDVQKVVVDSVYKADEFTTTLVGTTPTVTASALPGAVALITTPATDFSGANMQVVGSQFKLDADKPAYFGCAISISDATQSDLLVGLCGIDTTLTAASGTHEIAVSAGGAFFSKIDGVTGINFKTYKTTSETNSASVGTMDTSKHIYEMYWDGETLKGYFDGEEIGSFTADYPVVVLTPSIAFRAGAAAVTTCTVHWVRAFQVRS